MKARWQLRPGDAIVLRFTGRAVCVTNGPVPGAEARFWQDGEPSDTLFVPIDGERQQ